MIFVELNQSQQKITCKCCHISIDNLTCHWKIWRYCSFSMPVCWIDHISDTRLSFCWFILYCNFLIRKVINYRVLWSGQLQLNLWWKVVSQANPYFKTKCFSNLEPKFYIMTLPFNQLPWLSVDSSVLFGGFGTR